MRCSRYIIYEAVACTRQMQLTSLMSLAAATADYLQERVGPRLPPCSNASKYNLNYMLRRP